MIDNPEKSDTMKTYNRRVIARALSMLTLFASCTYFVQAQPNFDFGKSYVNVTKGVNGGTVEPGDILEIRATFVVSKTGYADSCGYFDAIPANTSFIPGSLAVLTNEGKVYKSFTDAPGDDAGYITGSAVRINLGFKTAPQATAFRRGRVSYNDKPSFYGATCIMIASFRVVVTGSYGSTVSLGGGSISYRINGAGSVTSNTFDPDNVMIFKNLAICPSTSGTNAILSESGGTFGSAEE